MSRPRTLPPEESTSRTALPAEQRLVPLAYRVGDAGAALGVSDAKVWALIREGRLPARRLDGSTVIRREDLVAFVDALPLVRQAAEPPATPPPEPPPAVPRSPSPPVPVVPARQSPAPAPQHPPTRPPLAEAALGLQRLRPAAPPARPQPPAPTAVDPKAPYGRGRTGKPLPPPNPNGWGARTLRRPSAALAAIVGPEPISRPKTLERIWKHIHAGGLQRPADMRVIHADEKLQAVVGIDIITMYALEELIRPHVGVITE